MGQATDISWTDMVWNPVRGCSRVSPGCERCYAETMAARFPWGAEVTSNGRWNGKIQLLPEKLAEPLKWRKPCRVFVNSVSDLFHPGVPFDFVLRVFAVMEQAKRHTFQVLTKRPERMLDFCRTYGIGSGNQWPANVWAGVTVEDQKRAEERIPVLLHAPAAVRWLSCEPLLGPLAIQHYMTRDEFGNVGDKQVGDFEIPTGAIRWVVVGGESGPGARAFDVDNARSILNQCRAADVAFYFKQMGRHTVCDNGREPYHHADRDGRMWCEFPSDLQVQEWPAGVAEVRP